MVCICVCTRVYCRQLLKTELGSFFTEYLQNQLLTKGMVILRDKIRFYEGTHQHTHINVNMSKKYPPFLPQTLSDRTYN